MNKFIVDLVLREAGGIDGFSHVKNYQSDTESYLIYSIEKHEPLLICFEDYLFQVCSYEDDKKIVHVSYWDLKEAIKHVETENSK